MKLSGVFTVVFLILSSPVPEFTPTPFLFPDRHLIADVPYIRQKREHCGPATLAMVLGYYNVFLSQEELAEEFYRKEISGTLNLDLLISARRHGFDAETPVGSRDLLKKYISLNIPVIVMVRTSSDPERYHYLVIYGYDDTKELFRIHSGSTRDGTIGYREFDHIWNPTGNWMLVVKRKNWGIGNND